MTLMSLVGTHRRDVRFNVESKNVFAARGAKKPSTTEHAKRTKWFNHKERGKHKETVCHGRLNAFYAAFQVGGLQVSAGSVPGDRCPQGLNFERLADEGINATLGAGGRLEFFRKSCDHYDGLLG